MSRKKREFIVRFAVGYNDRGALSSVWRIWKDRNKDDIYVAPRSVAGVLKGSLHASGLCHFAVTAQHHARLPSAAGSRRITAWRRQATPTDGFVKVASILFASEFLSRNCAPIGREISLINPPEPGKAIIVDLLFARLAGEPLIMPHQRDLGRCTLSTGEQFLIIAGLVDDFDAGLFRRHFSPLQEATIPGFIIERENVDRDDLRGAILLPDLGDGVLKIVDIGQDFDSAAPKDTAHCL